MFVCLDLRSGTGCNAVNENTAKYCIQCGRPLLYSLQVHDPNTLIGHYRVLRMLGYGSFGAVYEAVDTQRPSASVAIKETLDPASIRNFQGEFATLQRLHHDSLPAYYDMFEHRANGYLVMEFVPGQNLDEVLQRRQGPLLEAQVLGYAVQICAALSYLHALKPSILHRDIKPANIRLTPDGLIKLVDFGLLKEGGSTTRSSRMGGTPAYAPLEQYSGQSRHTDPRSDIYSLGATLYHLLTNQEPLPATNRIAASSDPLPPPHTYNPGLSLHVSGAIMKAMNIRPDDRFTSADDFQRALMLPGYSANASTGPQPSAPGAAQRPGQPSARSVPPSPTHARPVAAQQRTPPPPAPSYARGPAERQRTPPPAPSDYAHVAAEKKRNAAAIPGLRAARLRKKAFIAYAPGDKKFAQDIAKVMRTYKVPVVEPAVDLQAGKNREVAFQEAIHDCTHLIAVLSPEAVAQPEFDLQISYALDNDYCVVPVVRRSCEPPVRIRSLVRIEFRGSADEEALTKLLRTFDTDFRKPLPIKRGCVVSSSLMVAGVIMTLLVLFCLLQLLIH